MGTISGSTIIPGYKKPYKEVVLGRGEWSVGYGTKGGKNIVVMTHIGSENPVGESTTHLFPNDENGNAIVEEDNIDILIVGEHSSGVQILIEELKKLKEQLKIQEGK